MSEEHRVNVDLAFVRDDDGDLVTTLAWGDPLEVLSHTETKLKVRVTNYFHRADGSLEPVRRDGTINRFVGTGRARREAVAPMEDVAVLRVDLVDVQQGDGSVIETPDGKVLIVDGGELQLFARYLANRFPGTSSEEPKEIDAMIVSHGDADHFAGLTEIYESESQSEQQAYKRLYIHPQRVFHNGLVKRPSPPKEIESFGRTAKRGDDIVVTGLETDLLEVPESAMNTPFKAWKKALTRWAEHGPIEFRRLKRGDDDAFDFLDEEGVGVEVLGPITTEVDGEEGLLFLGNPPEGPRISHPEVAAEREFGGHSASHTINGHSIVLRLTFGSWRMLFAGDLNEQAELILTAEHEQEEIDLESEVFKVPHHGSADFSPSFLEAVSPVISVVSSGDDKKEYIHPRATLVGGLGKHSRDAEPVVWVTEMVAFFESVGWVFPPEGTGDDHEASKFFAFKRAAFGIVKVRTDGSRLLAYTNSGQADLKEAYAWEIDANGKPAATRILRA